VQHDGQLVGGERRDQPAQPANAGRRRDVRFPPVQPGAGDRGRRRPPGAWRAHQAAVGAVDLEPAVDAAPTVGQQHHGEAQRGETGQGGGAQRQPRHEQAGEQAEAAAGDDDGALTRLAVSADDRGRAAFADQIGAARSLLFDGHREPPAAAVAG